MRMIQTMIFEKISCIMTRKGQVRLFISLNLNAPFATKVVYFSRLLKSLRSLLGKSVDPDKTAPMSSLLWAHAVCFYA